MTTVPVPKVTCGSTALGKTPPVILYDYYSTRKADHPKEFLRNYSGILVTNGYQVYHSLEKQKDDLKIADWWVHAKRKYAEHVKAIGIPELEGTVAAQGVKLISKLLHLDGLYDKTKDKDQKDYRQREVAPKVDAYFAWVKETIMKVTTGAIPTRHSRIVWTRKNISVSSWPMKNFHGQQYHRACHLSLHPWV